MVDLFGNHIKDKKKEQDKEQASAEYLQKKSEIASAYFKALRLGLVEDALYWMLVMLKNGGKWHIATLLLEMAVEDVVDPTVLPFCKAVYDCVGKLKEATNHLVRATILVCRAEKWYQTAKGREDVEIWQRLEEEVKKQQMRKIPKYAVDCFTETGRKALKAKNWDLYCGKFSGSWKGWNNIAKWYVEGTLQQEIEKERKGVL